MNKMCNVDLKLLDIYLKSTAKGEVNADSESFMMYQNSVKACLRVVHNDSEYKTYKINVNERLNFDHTYIVQLPKGMDDEMVWREIDNCKGNGQLGDVTAVVNKYNGKIIDTVIDITPGVDVEIDEVEEVL